MNLKLFGIIVSFASNCYLQSNMLAQTIFETNSFERMWIFAPADSPCEE